MLDGHDAVTKLQKDGATKSPSTGDPLPEGKEIAAASRRRLGCVQRDRRRRRDTTGGLFTFVASGIVRRLS